MCTKGIEGAEFIKPRPHWAWFGATNTSSSVGHHPNSSSAQSCSAICLLVNPRAMLDCTAKACWSLLQGGQAGRGTAQHAELAQQGGNDSAFDPSVVTILEEAIALGIVPPFRCCFDSVQKFQ